MTSSRSIVGYCDLSVRHTVNTCQSSFPIHICLASELRFFLCSCLLSHTDADRFHAFVYPAYDEWKLTHNCQWGRSWSCMTIFERPKRAGSIRHKPWWCKDRTHQIIRGLSEFSFSCWKYSHALTDNALADKLHPNFWAENRVVFPDTQQNSHRHATQSHFWFSIKIVKDERKKRSLLKFHRDWQNTPLAKKKKKKNWKKLTQSVFKRKGDTSCFTRRLSRSSKTSRKRNLFSAKFSRRSHISFSCRFWDSQRWMEKLESLPRGSCDLILKSCGD